MAANRKLQALVEATLRKVDEGLAEFNQYWKKVEESTTANQREKNQATLKSEIKKLQRFRDDIMKWTSSSEIKEKGPLLEARRRIELEMERFKAYEREAKTKPFSYMGLQMEQKMDANEARRSDQRDLIEDQVQVLQQQIDELQADWEAENARKKKKSGQEQANLDDLKERIRRHGFHVMHLEIVLRRLGNDLIPELDDVDIVIEQVNEYTERQSDPTYFHDEDMYNHLNLMDQSIDASYYRPSLEEKPEATEEDSLQAIEDERKRKEARAKEIPLSAAAKVKAFKKEGAAAVSVGAGLHAPPPQIPPPAIPRPSPPSSLDPPALPVFDNPPDRQLPPAPLEPVTVAPAPVVVAAPVAVVVTAPVAVPAPVHVVAPSSKATLPPPPPPPKAPAIPIIPIGEKPTPIVDFSQRISGFLHSLTHRPIVEDTIIKQRPYAPTVPAVTNTSSDILSFYPKQLTNPETPSFYRCLSVETLLFAFYYREGSYSQSLAAKELITRGWRFHRKLKQWFKRQDEPSMVTNEFEIANFLTLDFHSEWIIKLKDNFTFDYSQTENALSTVEDVF